MATTTAAGSLGPGSPTHVNARWIVETREPSIMLVMAGIFDRMGPGLAENWVQITNSFTSGGPIAAISNGATEANAISDTDLTSTAAAITPQAHAASIVVSKMAEKTSATNIPDNVRQLLARSHADYIDTILMALFSSFTNSTGNTGERLDLSIFRAALTGYRNTCKATKRPQGIFHPTCWGHLIDTLISGGGAALSAILSQLSVADLFGGNAGEGMAGSYQGTLLGVDCWNSTNVSLSTNDRNNALITPANPSDQEDPMVSVGLVTKWDIDLSAHDLRVNAQLATRYMADMGLGVGIMNNALSRKILATQL